MILQDISENHAIKRVLKSSIFSGVNVQYLGRISFILHTFILLHTCMVDLKQKVRQKRDKIGRDNSQKKS